MKAYLSGLLVVYVVLFVPLFIALALVEGQIDMPVMHILLLTDLFLTLALTTPALIALLVQKRKGRA